MYFQHVVGGAVLRKNVQSIAIAQSLSCVSGYQLVGEQCVQCSLGQYYDSNTKMCKFCQKNTYTDEAGQTSCKPCDGNKVTLNDGATSQNLCVENCTAGYFYNMSSNSCQMCAKNFYQENSGLDYCNFCPIQKITTGTGSSSFTDCNYDCPVGQERVQSNQACVKCPVGMYRTQLNVKCVPCPSEFTTEGEGTTDESGCNIMIKSCPAGKYFNTNQDKCVECSIGFYQDKMGQFHCLPCGAGQTTRENGSVAITACKDDCPSGKELLPTGGCVPCATGSYRTQGVQSLCTLCPSGFTTLGKSSTSIQDCNLNASVDSAKTDTLIIGVSIGAVVLLMIVIIAVCCCVSARRGTPSMENCVPVHDYELPRSRAQDNYLTVHDYEPPRSRAQDNYLTVHDYELPSSQIPAEPRYSVLRPPPSVQESIYDTLSF